MKIAKITQPLLSNYGGILQNYALQQVLIGLGHQPITLYFDVFRIKDWFRCALNVIVKGTLVRYRIEKLSITI